ncbi:FAD-dependent oxidoreductase [Alteromonas oceanisediminis]|uniref:FAD-dependent oxidoreductase n=1 Tax=Alteromonas oceanisediminis TaxID=2836180 RepID=UPI001BD9758C|nr:FAD-dependent oxidoreductase [Alteromonas oceanisediminis]MBT0588099.1 FAD-dependent oxidoreductase [Alteromonas oceanisediminis]
MYDVIVVGGGMIGASTALGLAQQGKTVAVIEKNTPQPFTVDQLPDIRLSALSLQSVTLLQALGVWQRIEQMRCKAYTDLSVWEQAQPFNAMARFSSADLRLDKLGYFVENRLTQLALHEALHQFDRVDWYTQHSIHAIDADKGSVTLSSTDNDAELIEAQWIIGADGAQSAVRQLCGIGQTGWQYAQHALGIIIALPQDSGATTWQEFRPSGPVAFLPMYDHYAALIWYDSAQATTERLQLDDEALYAAVDGVFPTHLPRGFSIVNRAAFPLARAHANRYSVGRVVLIGDAAHTINPLAGQGVNIGFKDVEALLSVFAAHEQVSEALIEKEYERKRRYQNALMMTTMDMLYVAFSNDITPLKLARNAGLALAERAGPLKRRALKYAIGF